MDNKVNQTNESNIKVEKKMSFCILSKANRIRHGLLKLTHGSVETPVFMPVGTQGICLFFEI